MTTFPDYRTPYIYLPGGKGILALAWSRRFHGPDSYRGGSGFLLVRPANRWGFVCSSRVPPVTAEKTKATPRGVVSLHAWRSGIDASNLDQHPSCHANSVTPALRKRYTDSVTGVELAVIEGGKP
jgi:hypothetical protein